MTGRVDVAAALHTAIAQLATGEPDAVYIAEALRLWLSSTDGINLEAALGVSPSWRSARRDALMFEVATYFPELSGRPLANAIIRAIADYEARCWPRDRRSGNRRPGLPGALFELLTLGARPLTAGSIRALVKKPLGNSQCRGDPSHEGKAEGPHARAQDG